MRKERKKMEKGREGGGSYKERKLGRKEKRKEGKKEEKEGGKKEGRRIRLPVASGDFQKLMEDLER